MNEAILATLYAYRLIGDEYFLKWFQKIDEYSFRHFKDQEYGEWFAYPNRQGRTDTHPKRGQMEMLFSSPTVFIVSDRTNAII